VISEQFGEKAELIKGKNGVFDVTVDDALIFSKQKIGRFPRNDEVLDLIRKARKG
jgi:selT/selW/selH-like putative selenoprotein